MPALAGPKSRGPELDERPRLGPPSSGFLQHPAAAQRPLLVLEALHRRLTAARDPSALSFLVTSTLAEDAQDSARRFPFQLASLVGLPDQREPSYPEGDTGTILRLSSPDPQPALGVVTETVEAEPRPRSPLAERPQDRSQLNVELAPHREQRPEP